MKKHLPKRTSPAIGVSEIGVVIIGRNEGERLRRCLDSVPKAVFVVYVDSDSTDGSVGVAASRGAEVVRLDMEKPFTAARARNEGAARLLRIRPDLSFIQFVDGDCELEGGWLVRAVDHLLHNPAVGAVCGRRRERFPARSIYNELCDQEWNTPIGRTEACGGDVLMRTSAFQNTGGYDPALTAGEEPELCFRMRALGWEIWRLDAPMTIHDAAMERFSQWWKRALRSGFGYAQVWCKTRGLAGGDLYQRELLRCFFWTIGVLAVAGIGAALGGALLLLVAPAVLAAQLLRLSFKHGARKGSLLLLAKFPECAGATRALLAVALHQQHSAISYK